MRISATILPVALLAAFAGFSAPAYAGARGPVVIRGLGPDDFAPRATVNFRPPHASRPPRHWRDEEPSYGRATFAPRRIDVASEEMAPWPRPQRNLMRYRALEPAPVPYVAPVYYAQERNPYDRSYRPGAYTAIDPIPQRPAQAYGYFLDEGPFPSR